MKYLTWNFASQQVANFIPWYGPHIYCFCWEGTPPTSPPQVKQYETLSPYPRLHGSIAGTCEGQTNHYTSWGGKFPTASQCTLTSSGRSSVNLDTFPNIILKWPCPNNCIDSRSHLSEHAWGVWICKQYHVYIMIDLGLSWYSWLASFPGLPSVQFLIDQKLDGTRL